jgi:hypothetical protein
VVSDAGSEHAGLRLAMIAAQGVLLTAASPLSSHSFLPRHNLLPGTCLFRRVMQTTSRRSKRLLESHYVGGTAQQVNMPTAIHYRPLIVSTNVVYSISKKNLKFHFRSLPLGQQQVGRGCRCRSLLKGVPPRVASLLITLLPSS